MNFTQLIIISILVEAIWENIKMIYQNKKISISMIASLLISIFLCIVANIDIFPILEISISMPIIGNIFTGVIVSRGANFVNDLFSKLKGVNSYDERN